MDIPKLFNCYLLPGLVFQSVIVAGGYGTGQEMVQYFLSLGPISGLLGIGIAVICWSIVAILTYEFARQHQAFDYRTLFKKLLGKGWVLFEIGYFLVLMIVLSVVAASIGSIGQELLSLPYNVGIAFAILYVALFVLKGSKSIEKMFSIWSLLLYCVFFFLCLSAYQHFDQQIINSLTDRQQINPDFVFQGVKYAAYNLGLIPAVFFSLRHLETRKHSVISGSLTGIITMIPGIFLYLAMLSAYPEILTKTLPSTAILTLIGNPILSIMFSVVLLGTLLETAVGLLHALNQRLEIAFLERNKPLPKINRVFVSISVLVFALGLSQAGLIALISNGYALLSLIILLIYVTPLLFYYLSKGFKSRITSEPSI